MDLLGRRDLTHAKLPLLVDPDTAALPDPAAALDAAADLDEFDRIRVVAGDADVEHRTQDRTDDPAASDGGTATAPAAETLLFAPRRGSGSATTSTSARRHASGPISTDVLAPPAARSTVPAKEPENGSPRTPSSGSPSTYSSLGSRSSSAPLRPSSASRSGCDFLSLLLTD